MAIELTEKFLKETTAQRPDYKALCDQTREALACYFEGEALRRQIVQYPKEDQEKFAWRREAMLNSYDNYVKEVAEAYIEGVFRTKLPVRKSGSEKLDEYLNDDSDGFAAWFLQDFAPFALFMPEIYVVCDVPEAKGEVVSLADKEELQGLPFPTIRFPQYCNNMGFDSAGNLEWVTFYWSDPPSLNEQATTDENPTATAAKENNETLYEIYTDAWWGVFNQDGEWMPPYPGAPALPVEHKYGFLPVVRVTYRQNLSAQDAMRTGYAFMQSIVKLTLGGLTAKGVLHDFQYYSLFPKLVAGEGTIDNMIEAGMGANKPIAVPSTDTGIAPNYLNVPMNEYDALERIAFERIPAAVYRAARLRDRSAAGPTQIQSGISKLFDMVPEIGVLKAVAKFLRRSDIAICKMLTLLADGNPDAVEVEYPSQFDTKSVSELMTELTEFGDAQAKSKLPTSKTALLVMAERAVRAMLPDLPQSMYDTMDAELKVNLAVIAKALQQPPVGAGGGGFVSDRTYTEPPPTT